MAKRRRERDRPKAAHDAPYNPNKRVHLCYASDEEEGNLDSGPVKNTAPLPDANVAAVVEEPLHNVDSDGESSSHSSAHRELFEEAWEEDDLDDVEDEASTAAKTNSLWSRGIRKNTTTGQWAALGSLAYQWEEGEDSVDQDAEDYDSEEQEALSYLRAVRSERQSMPMVFKAPKIPLDSDACEDEDGGDDTRGYYEDGAYVARANLGPAIPDSAKTLVEPQEAFTQALKRRFFRQRDYLHRSPNPEALTALDEKHPISFPARNNKAYAEWHRLVRTSPPQAAQIRAMEQMEVFRLLELIEKHYIIRETEVSSTLSSWVWSLLARLDDVGTMGNDQVWVLRELGRKAVLVQLSFSDSTAAQELERVAAVDQVGVDTVKAESSPIQEEIRSESSAAPTGDQLTADAAQSLNVKSEEPCSTRQNTLATLDMIIVLIGEVFGQRDLLDFRQPWTAS